MMRRHRRTISTWLAAGVAVLTTALPAAADGKTKVYKFTGTDLAGAAVTIPHAQRPTIMLMLRINQQQSRQTVQNVQAALKGLPPIQVLVALSGKQDPDMVKAFAKKFAWPVVLDPDYAIIGQFRIRVWPTVLVVAADGRELTRLTGLPESQRTDLRAWLSFATGRIDRETLAKQLAATHVVADLPRQMAMRHLRVAERLLERGQVQQARVEVAEGLKRQPTNPRLLLTQARILLLLRRPEQAMDVLDRLDARSSLAARIGVLKGGALVALKRWDRAVAVLQTAVRLNPDPAEAHYFLGAAYQSKGQSAAAARAFQLAFEATPTGRHLASALRPPVKAPTTQPTTRPATATTAPAR